ncbi:hypothetical protein [Candidatus Chlamydia corallus]|nr:hypothetical protein [Candidatus Chlamydia corallus]
MSESVEIQELAEVLAEQPSLSTPDSPPKVITGTLTLYFQEDVDSSS